MASDSAGIYYPTNEDTFDPAADMESLAKSVPGLLVAVVNRVAADEYVAARTSEGRPPTESDPVFVWRADTDQVERDAGSGWSTLGATPVYALLQRTSRPNISSGSNTNLTSWPVTETSGDVSVTSGVITLNRAGIYQVGFSVPWANSGVGNRAARVYKTGTATPVVADIKPGQAGVPTFCTGSLPLRFAAGDSLYLEVNQSSGGSLEIQGDDYPLVFSATYLGA